MALGIAVVLPALWWPAVPMPGSYLGAAAIGLASACFALAWAIWRGTRFPLERIPRVVAWCLGARLFFDGLLRWKARIADNGFPWDDRLAQVDRWLHAGPAWELLPLTAPAAIRSLDGAYYLWFPVLTAGILLHAWHPDTWQRTRFALAFVLTWILLGIVCASLFVSAGPIFTGADEMSPLMSLLDRAAPLNTLEMRTALWNAYTDNGTSSISAMPSLHVAIPVVYALSMHSWMRAVFALYAGIILVASVMLGWHYAIDGYVAILGAVACWWLAGQFTPARPRAAADSRGEARVANQRG